MTTLGKRKAESELDDREKKVKREVADVAREIDQRLLRLLFVPVPKPEPYALLTPVNDAMRTLLQKHLVEAKTLSIEVVQAPSGATNTWQRIVAEWRDAQKQRRPPRNVDASAHLETFVIANEDPRVALRGETAVRATRRIAAGTVLLWYGGLLMTAQTPCGGLARLWSLDAYGYHTSAHDVDGTTQLSVAAIEEHGGIAKYINDARIDVSKRSPERENAAFGELVVNKHVPFVFVYATKDIAAGAEILVNYGAPYWSTFASRRAEHIRVCDEAVAIRKLLRDLI